MYKSYLSRCWVNDDNAAAGMLNMLMMKSKCEDNLEFSGYAGGREASM